MIRRVYFYGALDDKFGAEPLELSADSITDVLLALKSIFPGWRAHLRDYPEIIFVSSGDNKENPQAIEKELIDMGFGEATEIHIMPAQDGAWAALIMGAEWALAHAVAAFVIDLAVGMVVSTVLSAIVQSMAAQPETGAGQKNQVAQNQSFLFNGAVNVSEQGGAVPIIYGIFMAGSTVISAEIATEQLAVASGASAVPANSVVNSATQKPNVPAQSWQWGGESKTPVNSAIAWKAT